MPFPMDLSHCLAFAPARVPLVVTRIAPDTLRAYCDAHGLHEGDHVRCTPTPAHALLLEKPDGERVELPATYGFFIEAEPDPPDAAPSA